MVSVKLQIPAVSKIINTIPIDDVFQYKRCVMCVKETKHSFRETKNFTIVDFLASAFLNFVFMLFAHVTLTYSIFFSFLIVPASAADSSASCVAVARSSSRLTVGAGGFAADLPRSSLRPSNQSAEQACSRQIFCMISAPGNAPPASYLAHALYLMPIASAISRKEDGPRSSLILSPIVLINTFHFCEKPA